VTEFLGWLMALVVIFGGPTSFAVAGVAWTKVFEAEAEARTWAIETGNSDFAAHARRDRIVFGVIGTVASAIAVTIFVLFLWMITA
jgi:hypothetical protein